MPKILKIDTLIDRVSDYIQFKFDLVKNEMASHLSGLIAAIFTMALLLFFLSFFCLFISLAGATLLNNLLNSEVWGYVIISVLYLGLFVVAIMLAKSGKMKKTINKFLPDNDE